MAAEIVKLNVGGTIYTTSRSTLTRYPNSMLGAMFSERMPTTKDEHDNYWIDGNGDMFRYVLDFLRRSQLLVPDGFTDFDLLEKEADFYQIPDLILAIKHSKILKQGHGNLYKKVRYVAVNFSEGDGVGPNSVDDTLDIYGPKDVLEQIKHSLDQYSDIRHQTNTIEQRSECSIRIHPYHVGVISQHTLVLMFLNLGLKLCPAPPYTEWRWESGNEYDMWLPVRQAQWFMLEEQLF